MSNPNDFRNMNNDELNALGADYEGEFSEQGFWSKVRKVASKVGGKVLEPALKLYYAARDTDTPAWARSVIIGALGYFISPVDLVPDLIPVLGYTDDATVIAGAIATVAAHIKEEHTRKAKETCRQWLG